MSDSKPWIWVSLGTQGGVASTVEGEFSPEAVFRVLNIGADHSDPEWLHRLADMQAELRCPSMSVGDEMVLRSAQDRILAHLRCANVGWEDLHEAAY